MIRMSVAVRRIAIIQGNPDPCGRHFGHALAEAYTEGARGAGREVHVIDVATLDFPLLRSRDDMNTSLPPEGIRAAQAELLQADHLMMIYPVWNGTMPALTRGFLEQTFRSTFMFPDTKPGDTLGFVAALKQRKALAGKTARIVVTMQMPAFVYRWYFHPHPERNTLRLSGLRPVRETLVGQVEANDGRKRDAWLRALRTLGVEGQERPIDLRTAWEHRAR